MRKKIGIIHPGAMGIAVAASMQNSGCDVYWASAGRSPESKARAAEHQLLDAGTVDELCSTCDALVVVCPPAAAETVATYVASIGFDGLYVDGNAIAPQRAESIGRILHSADIAFVDGSIIGGPPKQRGTTWLYLSGERAAEAASYFTEGPLETTVLGSEIGQASAIKMCFAAYSKGTTALMSAILATAESLNVRDALETQWDHYYPERTEQAHNSTRRVTQKAWRFAGEMEEIAATFGSVGLPTGFHDAASTIYERMAHFKGAEELPELDEVLAAVLKQDT